MIGKVNMGYINWDRPKLVSCTIPVENVTIDGKNFGPGQLTITEECPLAGMGHAEGTLDGFFDE